MTIAVVPSDNDVTTLIKKFLSENVLASSVQIVHGQVNRVPMPNGDYVVMTPTMRERLETNVDTYADLVFTASVAGNVMTVTAMDPRFYPAAKIQVGTVLFGVGIPANTFVLSGTSGGTGVYTLNRAITFLPGKLAAGTETMLQPVKVTVQLDVYGPNSADNAHTISTFFRDERASSAFESYGFDMTPLYADNPKFLSFVDAEMQYEDRWMIEACIQANQAVINVPQQFADQIVVGLIDVDTFYPA